MSHDAPTHKLAGEPRLLNIAEVADLANITERAAKHLFTTRRFPVVKVGRAVRVWSTDLAAYLEANTRPAREADSRA